MHTHEIVTICGILAVGFACQWIGWRLKIPAIFFLLLAGLALGPVANLVDPNALFGDLLVPLVSIAVAIILFEGSLTLKFSELKGHGAVVRNLITLGVLVTWVSSTALAYYVLGWEVQLAALFGAIVTVSGPTVVIPLLRAVRPTKSVSRVLRWEAILIDPVGAILGLLVFDYMVASQASSVQWEVAQTLTIIVAAGALLGVTGGYLFGLAIRHRVIPDFLREFSTLAMVLGVFAVSESVHGESGLLAVTVMGIWIANMRDVDIDDVLHFKENLTLLLVAGLFIVLAARVDLPSLLAVAPQALIVVVVLQLVAGPLRALVCSIGSELNWRERLFLGWVFPRGIVAAAISALFALQLEGHGFVDTGLLVPVVFTVILGTVVVQSLSAGLVARMLRVAEQEATGLLIVGSNPVALALAAALQECGQTVLIADTHWASIQEARMAGLSVFYGSVVSGFAENNLDLSGIGQLLAVSRQPGINELACVRFTEEFGRNAVFTIKNRKEAENQRHRVSGESGGRIILDDTSLIDLLERIARGEDVTVTELTDSFDFDDYQNKDGSRLPLFAIDEQKQLHFPVVDQPFRPGPGWIVGALAA